MGWFADGSMVYPFNQAVLTHNVGEYTLVESMFGFHVIKVTEKQDPVKKVRVAMVDVGISPSQETFQNVFTNASEFQGRATDLDSFDTLATNMGLNKRSAPNLLAMGNRIDGLDYPRSVIQWTYIDGIGVGSISPVFTMEDKYVVAIVTKVSEKGIPSLDEIRDILEPLIIKDLKGDIMVERLKEMVDQASDIYQIADKLNAKVDTVESINMNMRNVAGYGNEADVLGAVFTMEPNVLSQPIKGNNAAFFVIVDEMDKPKENEDYKIYERQLLMNFKSKVNNNSFTKTLEEEADIVDNRVKFY